MHRFVGVALTLGVALGAQQARAQQNLTASTPAELATAITTCNGDPLGGTITLTASTFAFTTGSAGFLGNNALPTITGTVTIEGAGAALERDPADLDQFRFLEVTSTGSLTLRDTTLRGGISNLGGALYADGTLLVERCAFTGNSSTALGGAVGAQLASPKTLRNCTLDGNTALGGGALYSTTAVTVVNCTIVRNSATDIFGGGGGISTNNTVTLSSVILALNTSSAGSPDGEGSFNVERSFIGNDSGMVFLTDTTNTRNGGDPSIGALLDNGGPTPTCALTASSANVLDLGADNGLATDQRGYPRVSNGAADRGAFEFIEVPVALSAAAPDILSTGVTTYTFTVTFVGDDLIDGATIDASGDVTVTGPGGFSQGATRVGAAPANAASVTVTYEIVGPGGGWTAADNGAYTVNVLLGSVADTDADVVAATAVGAFDVALPRATAAAADVTVAGGTTHSIVVTYTDAHPAGAIDVATLGSGTDIVVSGPGGSFNGVFVQPVAAQTNGTPRDGTYEITIPGGWSAADSGAYTIAMQAGAVSDTSGNSVLAETIGAFNVTVPDTTAPTATATSAGVTTGGAIAHIVTVTYTDDVLIESTTLTTGDVTVSRTSGAPAFADTPTIVTAQGADAASKVIEYSFAPPGGSWDESDNGTYTFAMVGGEVTDTTGNPVAGNANLVSFVVNIDETAPTATATSDGVTTGGAIAHIVTVTYTDGVLVESTTLTTGDVTVSGPGGTFTATPTIVTAQGADAASKVIEYSFAPPGGSWDAADNGTYTFAMVAGEVSDTSGNFVAASANLASFVVNISAGVPTAVATVTNVTSVASVYTFTVRYEDDVAVSVASLGSGTDVVVNPGALAATFVSVDVASDGTPRVATYTITPPGGAWDTADNGTYTVAMQAGQVTDTAANAVAAGTIGTFTVGVDTTAPTATLNASALTSPATQHTFTVTYADDVAIDVSTPGTGDLLVTGPSAFSQQPTFVSVDVGSNGTPRVATYRITVAGGVSSLENGTYTVAMLAGQVTDTSGNAVAAGTIGSVTVNVVTSSGGSSGGTPPLHGSFRASDPGTPNGNSGVAACSLATSSAGASGWAPLALAAMVLLALRRRARRA